MGLEDMVDKAKGLVGDNPEAVEGAIDKAADAAKQVAPDQADATIDTVAEKAKDALGGA